MSNNDLQLFFNEFIKLNPCFSINIGLKSPYFYSHIENTYSEEYRIKFKNILNKYKNTKNISLHYVINNYLNIYKNPFHLMPITSFENPIINFDFMNDFIYPKNKIYLKSRIIDFYKIIDTYMMRMKEGLYNNITIPKIICKKLIKDLSKNIFKKRYKTFLYFLKNKYFKKCRNSVGLCGLPNGIGKNMYQLLIDYHCKYHIKPQNIHKYGKNEVAKLFKLLQNEKKSKKKFCSSKKELLNLYKSHYNYINDKILPKNFNYIPKTKCKILPVVKNMESSSAFAFYMPLLGTFYINTKSLDSHAKQDMLTLTMHESVPGHHYQFYYMKEKKLPLYMQYGIDNNAFVEGWGLYAETLGPYSKGFLTAQLFRAVRLVIDTGIHYYGWSFKKAFNYMKKYVAYSDEEIKSEIYRYICIPGQAVSYYLGKKYILKLKFLYIKKYKLGDIKSFHDFLLEDGIVTFDYLMNKLHKLAKK